ncbi:MAG: hypothetical protein RLZZ505_1520 [Verrucomicrobiota bacterium]|jgi:hypothetical protein
MLRKIQWVFTAIVLLFAALYGFGFYLKLRRAKVVSQCAVLSAEIGNYLIETDNTGKPPDIEGFLLDYDVRGLFTRDGSGQLIDSWGYPLHIRFEEISDKLEVTVTSVGLDGKLGTNDDFSREFAREIKHANPQ